MFFLLFCATLSYILFYEFYWKRRNFPPGPTPLPVIGNMLEMFSYPAPGTEAFAAWTKKFGNIYTIWMGTDPTIVITRYKDLKDNFIGDGESYTDKALVRRLNDTLRGGDYGVIDNNGNTWKEHRRFALHTLRDFGLGKEAMEESVQLEVSEIVSELKNSEGQDVDVQPLFDLAIGNVINQFLFGHRFSDLKRFHHLKYLLDLFFELQGRISIYFAYFVNFMPQFLVNLMTTDVVKIREGVFTFFGEQIEEHLKEIDFDLDDSKDYVETFLKERKKREALGDFETFSDDNLRNMCFDIWVAGLHTTSSTMGLLVAWALNNPTETKKMQEELSEVIGDRIVTMKDKQSLPYTLAFVHEAQRIINLVPINFQHQTTREVTLAGYKIPKGVAVLPQVSSVLADPDVFPDPDVFRPTNFLDANGQFRKREEFLPFSIGRRVCVGEQLARMELFLFTSNLFNQFEFITGKGGSPSLERTFSAVAKAHDYTCRMKSRYN